MRGWGSRTPRRWLGGVVVLAAAAVAAGGVALAQASDRPWRAAVSGVVAAPGAAAGGVDVWWDAHPEGAVEYRVAWAPVGEGFRAASDSDWNVFTASVQVTLSGLEPGGSYQVRVRARFDGRGSRWSNTATVEAAQASDRPWRAAVSGVVAAPGAAAGGVDVWWDAHPEGAVEYRVAWAPVGEGFRAASDSDWNVFTASVQVTLSGLEPGGSYQVRVRALFDTRRSRWSNTATVEAEAVMTVGPRAVPRVSVAPQIDGDISFSVEEGTATVTTLVATDDDTDAEDLEWSTVGGADQSHFALTEAGELSFGAVKDFENPGDSDSDGVYEVSVSVSDGTDSDTVALTVTVTNVIELTTLAGPVDVAHSENWAGRVATYSASSASDAGGLVWSLSGADAARFSIDDPGGALRFSIDPTGDDLFLRLPDFDDPLDDDSDGIYEVTVEVAGGGDEESLDVDVTVADEPEPGTLALSATRPRLGATLTATLTDPDGVTGTVAYVWERSVDRGTWVTLTNTAAAYVTTPADTGRFLRVTATYQDGHGADTATARTSEVVTADLLTALAVSTTDSTANPGHALRPSFDAGILHYSIGCATSDTMTLVPTAGSGVRLSIGGTQVTSGESRTVDVDADSEVRVVLAAASGAATTYFVRCLSGDLLDMTATTATGASGVIEDLIVFGVDNEGERSVAIVDSNGAVRFHDKDAAWSRRVLPRGVGQHRRRVPLRLLHDGTSVADPRPEPGVRRLRGHGGAADGHEPARHHASG